MIAFLLLNWKPVVTGLGVFALCLFLHKLDVARIEFKHAQALQSVRNSMTKACNEVQETTREVSHDYQTKLANLNAKYAALKRMHYCVPINVKTPGRRNATEGDKGLPRADGGITSEALREYARDAEQTGLQLDACQDFLRRTSK